MSDLVWFKKGQDVEYAAWHKAHYNDGYIVNKDGSTWKLHYPSCETIYDVPVRKKQSLTTYTKICSTSKERLIAEARRYGGHIVETCNCQKY